MMENHGSSECLSSHMRSQHIMYSSGDPFCLNPENIGLNCGYLNVCCLCVPKSWSLWIMPTGGLVDSEVSGNVCLLAAFIALCLCPCVHIHFISYTRSAAIVYTGLHRAQLPCSSTLKWDASLLFFAGDNTLGTR